MHVFLKRTAVSMIALVMAMPLSAEAQTAKTVPQSQTQMQLSFAPLVKQTSGAVVNVYAERVVQRQSPFAGDPFVDQFVGQFRCGQVSPRQLQRRTMMQDWANRLDLWGQGKPKAATVR